MSTLGTVSNQRWALTFQQKIYTRRAICRTTILGTRCPSGGEAMPKAWGALINKLKEDKKEMRVCHKSVTHFFYVFFCMF